jgi:cell division protein FtsL
MSNDKFQDKYDEIFQSIKEEKMDWDFEDFLKKAEGKEDEVQNDEAPIIPIDSKNKPSFPKWFWMAASVVLLLSIGFIFNYNKNSGVEDQAQLVENQIKNQKADFIEENSDHQEQVALNHPSDSISGAKKDSIFQENTVAEKDVLDEILPKRGRLKKERKPKFVYNSSYNKASKDSTGYKDSYVIVNGKRIENVEEAINVTKYSFQIFANNVSEKLVKPTVVDDDY